MEFQGIGGGQLSARVNKAQSLINMEGGRRVFFVFFVFFAFPTYRHP